jgi:hypothetical protein
MDGQWNSLSFLSINYSLSGIQIRTQATSKQQPTFKKSVKPMPHSPTRKNDKFMINMARMESTKPSKWEKTRPKVECPLVSGHKVVEVEECTGDTVVSIK